MSVDINQIVKNEPYVSKLLTFEPCCDKVGTMARLAPKTTTKPDGRRFGRPRLLVAVVSLAAVAGTAWTTMHVAGNMALADSDRKLAAGDPGSAVASAREAVKLLPGDAEALYQLGKSQASLHDHLGALGTLRQAHQTAPGDRDIFLAECRENLYASKVDSLLAELTAYVNAHNSDAEAMLLLGQTYERMASVPANANTSLYWERTAQGIDPGNEEITATLGARYISANRPTDALLCYQHFLDKHSDSTRILQGALFCYNELGQPAKAAEIAARLGSASTRAIDIPPFRPAPPVVPSTGPMNTPAKFVDVTAASGLDHKFTTIDSKPQNILQTIGAGCAFLDYDNDGNLDILLVDQQLKLYRGDGHGRFVDVTKSMGLDRVHGYFLGCAVGDYDNDGFDDILLTGYATVALLRNDHAGRFTNSTATSGLQTTGWNTSATWGDIDNDGKLDLYICRYLDFPPGDMGLCVMGRSLIACGPYKFGPQRGELYRNLGNGKFSNITKQWGVNKTSGKGLGAAFADVDGSGLQSLYITDDQVPSNLYLNAGAAFRDVSRTSGASVREDGKGFSGMGIDWGDYDNDGKLDVAAMAFQSEEKRILHNEGNAVFTQQYNRLGMRAGSQSWISFGMKWLDYDNDGWLDMIYSNGPTDLVLSELEPTMLYHNEQGAAFIDASAGLIGPARRSIEGRGLAVGDYENNGLVDALVVDNQGGPLLLHNETANPGHWLDINLIGAKSNRDGYGAEVTATVGRSRQIRVCHADGSYLSSSDKRVHLGLGSATAVDGLDIRWPSGQVDKLTNVAADKVITVVEGKGIGP